MNGKLRCIKCGDKADYIVNGDSLCKEHKNSKETKEVKETKEDEPSTMGEKLVGL